MPLSEYELRILQEMEIALRTARFRRFARTRRAVGAYWRLVLVILVAVATVVLLAVFASGAAAAPLSCITGAVAGWTAASFRRRRSTR